MSFSELVQIDLAVCCLSLHFIFMCFIGLSSVFGSTLNNVIRRNSGLLPENLCQYMRNVNMVLFMCGRATLTSHKNPL